MVGRCERATEKQHINGCGTIMNNTGSWSRGNVGGVLISYPAACNPPRILPSPLAKVCNRQHKWSLFYGVCTFTWLLRQWLPLKHRQHGNELRTRISQHCLLESWNYLLSFPCALKCNHYFTLLSSRWLSMNLFQHGQMHKVPQHSSVLTHTHFYCKFLQREISNTNLN